MGCRARWAVLAGLTIVSFLLLLDDTAVSVALPAIRRQLGVGLSGLKWVVNGYTVPIAGLMLLAGKLADRHDRRSVFLDGLAVFVLASLVAGLAGQPALLIAARRRDDQLPTPQPPIRPHAPVRTATTGAPA